MFGGFSFGGGYFGEIWRLLTGLPEDTRPDATADVIIQVRADVGNIFVRPDVGLVYVRADVGDIDI